MNFKTRTLTLFCVGAIVALATNQAFADYDQGKINTHEQAEITALAHRLNAMERTPHTAITAATAACPDAAQQCTTVPDQYATGQVITGSAGWGGTQVEYNDVHGAPEGWFRYGSWYVAVRPGYLGYGFCLDEIPRHPTRKDRTGRNVCLGEKQFNWILRESK